MSADGGEKKFELSDRRRQQLRQEGSVPRSHDVSTATILGVGLTLLILGGAMMIGYLREIMGNAFVEVGHANVALTPRSVGAAFSSGLWIWLAVFLVAIALAVFISQVAQVGLTLGDEVLGLKFDRLNPLANLKNVFSLNKVTQSGQSLVKLTVVASFAYFALHEIQDSPVFQRPVNLRELGETYANIAWSLGWRITMVLGVLAGGDLLWQRWKFSHDHRMTFEEVKEERRSMEASPEVIRKRRQMARKISMRRMMENLETATVVVTNPTHYAVALRYKKGETEAPIVVAKGIRKAALRIKERAYDLRIAVREDRPLARGLYKYGKIDQPIPPIFYQGVAAILAALYKQGFHASDIYNRPAAANGARAEDREIWNTEKD